MICPWSSTCSGITAARGSLTPLLHERPDVITPTAAEQHTCTYANSTQLWPLFFHLDRRTPCAQRQPPWAGNKKAPSNCHVGRLEGRAWSAPVVGLGVEHAQAPAQQRPHDVQHLPGGHRFNALIHDVRRHHMVLNLRPHTSPNALTSLAGLLGVPASVPAPVGCGRAGPGSCPAGQQVSCRRTIWQTSKCTAVPHSDMHQHEKVII